MMCEGPHPSPHLGMPPEGMALDPDSTGLHVPQVAPGMSIPYNHTMGRADTNPDTYPGAQWRTSTKTGGAKTSDSWALVDCSEHWRTKCATSRMRYLIGMTRPT